MYKTEWHLRCQSAADGASNSKVYKVHEHSFLYFLDLDVGGSKFLQNIGKICFLANYAWPRTSSIKVTRKEIRDVSTFTAQHVRAATRSIKCERQWRHVALATAGPMLVTNNMAAYPLRISNSVCPLRISNTCLMSVHTIHNHVKSIICYLCFMQHVWSC